MNWRMKMDWERLMMHLWFGPPKRWSGNTPTVKEVCRMVRMGLSYQQRQTMDKSGLCKPYGAVPWRMKVRYCKQWQPTPLWWTTQRMPARA